MWSISTSKHSSTHIKGSQESQAEWSESLAGWPTLLTVPGPASKPLTSSISLTMLARASRKEGRWKRRSSEDSSGEKNSCSLRCTISLNMNCTSSGFMKILHGCVCECVFVCVCVCVCVCDKTIAKGEVLSTSSKKLTHTHTLLTAAKYPYPLMATASSRCPLDLLSMMLLKFMMKSLKMAALVCLSFDDSSTMCTETCTCMECHLTDAIVIVTSSGVKSRH